MENSPRANDRAISASTFASFTPKGFGAWNLIFWLVGIFYTSPHTFLHRRGMITMEKDY